MEAEHKRQDELKHQAETAKEAERKAKYELALAREEERKMVSESCSDGRSGGRHGADSSARNCDARRMALC
jgi:hypothetical protein